MSKQRLISKKWHALLWVFMLPTAIWVCRLNKDIRDGFTMGENKQFAWETGQFLFTWVYMYTYLYFIVTYISNLS